MNNDLYHLVYVSSALPGLSHEQIQELVNTSCEKNTALNISGLLIYVEGNFLQVLEGEKSKVLSLYENIKQDSRHTNVIRILSEPAEERFFPDWSMAFKNLEVGELHSRCNHRSLLEIAEIRDESARDKVHILIRSFLDNIYVR